MVTDGNDNASTITLETWSRLAQQNDVLIYAIGLLSEEEQREAAQGQARAGNPGGEHRRSGLFSKDVSEVDQIAHDVARDIRSQYTIEYTPSNHGPGWHFPPDQGGRESPGKSDGAYAQWLLRIARQENRG